jgi:hypothetical protein
VPDLLAGAWDVHVHAAPSLFPRRHDAQQLASEAQAAGYEGVVWKSHHGSTVEAAAVLNAATPGLTVRGGLTLNRFVGGLNPDAADAAVALGAAVVWLPTIDAAHHGRALGTPGGFSFQKDGLKRPPPAGFTLTDERGRLRGEVHAILEVLSGTPTVLATGHASPAEIVALDQAIAARGGDVKLLINHALFHAPKLDIETLQSLASERVWVELCELSTRPPASAATFADVAAAVRAVPDAQWILATDAGQVGGPSSPEALARFARGLVQEGVSEVDVRRFITDHPREVLA